LAAVAQAAVNESDILHLLGVQAPSISLNIP
jgi:hypothetical protein